MASRAIDFGRASALPLDMLLAAIPSLPRPLLARLVSRAIDHMDEQDGDPDLEDDDPPELARMEWGEASGFAYPIRNEDDEDDDPAGGAVDDERQDPLGDHRQARCTYGTDQRHIFGQFGQVTWSDL